MLQNSINGDYDQLYLPEPQIVRPQMSYVYTHLSGKSSTSISPRRLKNLRYQSQPRKTTLKQMLNEPYRDEFSARSKSKRGSINEAKNDYQTLNFRNNKDSWNSRGSLPNVNSSNLTKSSELNFDVKQHKIKNILKDYQPYTNLMTSQHQTEIYEKIKKSHSTLLLPQTMQKQNQIRERRMIRSKQNLAKNLSKQELRKERIYNVSEISIYQENLRIRAGIQGAQMQIKNLLREKRRNPMTSPISLQKSSEYRSLHRKEESVIILEQHKANQINAKKLINANLSQGPQKMNQNMIQNNYEKKSRQKLGAQTVEIETVPMDFIKADIDNFRNPTNSTKETQSLDEEIIIMKNIQKLDESVNTADHEIEQAIHIRESIGQIKITIEQQITKEKTSEKEPTVQNTSTSEQYTEDQFESEVQTHAQIDSSDKELLQKNSIKIMQNLPPVIKNQISQAKMNKKKTSPVKQMTKIQSIKSNRKVKKLTSKRASPERNGKLNDKPASFKKVPSSKSRSKKISPDKNTKPSEKSKPINVKSAKNRSPKQPKKSVKQSPIQENKNKKVETIPQEQITLQKEASMKIDLIDQYFNIQTDQPEAQLVEKKKSDVYSVRPELQNGKKKSVSYAAAPVTFNVVKQKTNYKDLITQLHSPGKTEDGKPLEQVIAMTQIMSLSSLSQADVEIDLNHILNDNEDELEESSDLGMGGTVQNVNVNPETDLQNVHNLVDTIATNSAAAPQNQSIYQIDPPKIEEDMQIRRNKFGLEANDFQELIAPQHPLPQSEGKLDPNSQRTYTYTNIDTLRSEAPAHQSLNQVDPPGKVEDEEVRHDRNGEGLEALMPPVAGGRVDYERGLQNVHDLEDEAAGTQKVLRPKRGSFLIDPPKKSENPDLLRDKFGLNAQDLQNLLPPATDYGQHLQNVHNLVDHSHKDQKFPPAKQDSFQVDPPGYAENVELKRHKLGLNEQDLESLAFHSMNNNHEHPLHNVHNLTDIASANPRAPPPKLDSFQMDPPKTSQDHDFRRDKFGLEQDDLQALVAGIDEEGKERCSDESFGFISNENPYKDLQNVHNLMENQEPIQRHNQSFQLDPPSQAAQNTDLQRDKFGLNEEDLIAGVKKDESQDTFDALMADFKESKEKVIEKDITNIQAKAKDVNDYGEPQSVTTNNNEKIQPKKLVSKDTWELLDDFNSQSKQDKSSLDSNDDFQDYL